MQKHFNSVFSFTQLIETKSIQPSIPIVIRFPNPQQPSEPNPATDIIFIDQQYYHSNETIETTFHGNVDCYDYQTVEAIYSRLSLRAVDNKKMNREQQQLKVAKLLFISFPTTTTIAAIKQSIIVIHIGLKDNYIQRSCQLPNLSWARRMWALASRANLISFTSVYYSVLGGAYSSLSKANAHYAYKAGSLAIHQIKFAQWLKDPILESKCWLYYAEDLIQLHRFKRVDKIIARQLAFAQRLNDPILLKMCDSVQTRRDRMYAEYITDSQ